MNKDIDISNVTINTERLVLRAWKISDLQDFYEYARVDGVGQMAGWMPHKDIEESRTILNRFIEGRKTFALEYRGKVVGSLGVEKYNEEMFPQLADKSGRELGFVLSRDYWGMGLMPEAVKAVIRYLFEQEKLDFLMCSHFELNERSRRVQQKCGFRKYAEYESIRPTISDEPVRSIVNILWNENK